MKNRIFNATLLALLSLGGASRLDAAVYNESGGLVIMEMENTASPLDLWIKINPGDANYVSGATGSGHLEFKGNTINGGPATSPLTYTFKINQGGNYHLNLRARKRLEGEASDKCNDCYVEMQGNFTSGSTNYGTGTLTQDTKLYGGHATQWAWATDLDGNGADHVPAIYSFVAGETYTLTLSGRSIRFNLDRIMFRHTSVSKSAAQNLSNPESGFVTTTADYIYDATEDFPSYLSGDVPYYIDNGNDALAIAANIESNRIGFARASRTFDGITGSYDVMITTLTEEDGESTYRLLVNGSVVGTFQNTYIGPGSPQDLEPETHTWIGIAINNGETLAIESNADTNGEIPEGTNGTAWARGRWRQLELSTSLVQPPAGRLAIVADGNSPDPDDIGATAVMLGILNGADLQDRLVHLSHSCDLVPTNIPPADELRRQAKLHELCGEGIGFFGPYDNLSDYYNCRSNQTEAVSSLTAAIDASTATDPLWVIEAGEPDIIGYALQAANPAKIPYVHLVSHHPANDNSGDFFTWAQILAFGVQEHQIGDQNVGLQVFISTGLWDWAENHSNPGIAWIWDMLKYAEQDGVVGFQTDKFDCSDAGMVYWWFTGANSGGNSNSTPVEMKDMLLYEGATGTPTITMAVLGSPVDLIAGSTWSDGLPAHSGADYVIPATGNLRSEDETSTFPGTSLTVQADGKFQVRAKEGLGEVTTVNDLRFSGGTSFAAGEHAQLAAGTGNDLTNVLDGAVTHSGYTRFLSYHAFSGGTISRSLKVLSAIGGDGHIQAWEGSGGYGGENVIIDNAANTFSGTWEVGADTTLIFNNAGAVGSADVEVLDTGQLKILGNWIAGSTLTVADTATVSVDLGTYAWNVSSLVFGGSPVADGTYSAVDLNALGTNTVFSGSGTIEVGLPPASVLIAGWDTWASTNASASVLASGVTASIVTTTEQLSWHVNDGRGASADGDWGTFAPPPTASTVAGEGVTNECLELPNATTGGTITFTISNGGTSDLELDAFHFDTYAFRPKAARTYELSVLAGGDITPGVTYTSGALEITSVGGAWNNLAHDDIDHSLTGLADHTLGASEVVQFRLAFSGGVGDGSGGHDLWVDNVGITGAPIPIPITEAPPLDYSMSGGELIFNWTGSGFKVQSCTNLTEGTWVDVPGGDVSPVNVKPSLPSAFFRLLEQ